MVLYTGQMKTIILCTIVLSFFFTSDFLCATTDLSVLVRKASDAVGLVITADKKKNVGYGSGYFISTDGDFVTNYHVVDKAETVIVKFPNEKIYRVKEIIGIDKTKDIAILKLNTDGESVSFIRMSKRVPELGERIFVMGNPMGLEQTVSDGIVSSVRDYKGFKFIQMTARISPGSSGGPVMNMDGDVVGIATLYVKKGQNLNFAVSVEEVMKLLEKVDKPYCNNFNDALYLVKKYYYVNDYVSARKYIDMALEFDPKGKGLYKFFAKILDSKQNQELVYLWSESIKNKHSNYLSELIFEMSSMEMGMIAAKKEKYVEAVKYLTNIKIPFGKEEDDSRFSKKNRSRVYNVLAYSYYQTKKYEESAKWYNYYLSGESLGNQMDFLAYGHLGFICFKLEKYSDAVNFLKKALRYTVDDQSRIQLRSRLLTMIVDIKFRIMKPRVKWLEEKSDSKSVNKLKAIFLKEKKYIRDRLKEAVSLWPENQSAWELLGKYRFYTGEYETALKIFYKLLNDAEDSKKIRFQQFIDIIRSRLK